MLSLQDKHRQTAMNLTTTAGHVDPIKRLKELGVDIPQSTKLGCTPIHCAALNGRRHANAIKAWLPYESPIVRRDKDI